MFVRKIKNNSGSISIQIIKKINGINKVIRTVGSSSDPNEINHLYQKGLYDLPRLYGATLFDHLQEPELSQLSNDNIRIIGPELIFGKIFHHIGFSAISDSIFRDLCISRITHAGSKLQLSRYLLENNREDISEDRIYYFMDRLHSKYKSESYPENRSSARNYAGLDGLLNVKFWDLNQ